MIVPITNSGQREPIAVTRIMAMALGHMRGMPRWSSAYAATRACIRFAALLHQLLLALFDRFPEVIEFVTESLTQSRERLRFFFLDVVLD
jgi:hypothetical protein